MLTAELERARAGEARTVVIDGAPGMGKTALARQFLALEAARAEGGRSRAPAVLPAGGDEWESGLAYGVMVELLTTAGPVGAELRARLATGDALEPLAVGSQLVSLIGDLAAAGPVVVVVDDIQWADLPSVQALTFALRRLRSDPVLTVILARDDAPGVAEGLRRLSQEHGSHLTLTGLDDLELSELSERLGGLGLSRAAARRLADHTGGNPLYAGALIHELTPESIERSRSGLPAPRSFAMVVLARLAACSEPARSLMEATSVLGRQVVPLALAAAVGEVADPLAALDEAVAAQLLEAAPSIPTAIAFAHPMARAAVYHHLGPGRRRALHRRAAVSVDDEATALAHRAAAAVGEDAELAAQLAAHARADAARGAISRAARDLQTAAQLHPEREARQRLVLDAAELLLRAGDAAAAAPVVATMADFPDSPRRRYLEGHLCLLQGRAAEAETILTQAWQRCDAGADGRLCSLISSDLAQLCSSQLRSGDAAEWVGRAIETSEDAEATAAALAVLVPCVGLLGRSAEGLAPSVGSRDNQPVTVGVDALLGQGVLRLWLDDLVKARADLADVVARSRHRPAARAALVARAALAEVEFRLGAWDDSVSDTAVALSLMEDSEQRWLAAILHASSTWVAAPRGDWDEAERQARAAAAAAEALGDALSAVCAAAAGAHVAFFRGDYEHAARLLHPLSGHAVENVPAQAGVHPWRPLHAESLLRLGRVAEAQEAVAVFRRLAVSWQRPSGLAYVDRLEAQIAAARGDDKVAGQHFGSARGRFADLSMPFEAAMTDEAYGRYLRRNGERRAAASYLQAALEVYGRLGARALIGGCETELAGCGLTPRRRDGDQSPELTPQELAVARLVATGRSNREAAADLVVSVKTIEHHLSSIYAKVGVRSRTQLAARMATTLG